MSKCLGDFSARLQGPAEGMAKEDWLWVLSVHVWGPLGGVQVTAVGRWVVARGLWNGQTGAWGSGVGNLGSWCEWGVSVSIWHVQLRVWDRVRAPGTG